MIDSKQKVVEWEEFSKLRSENTLLRTSLEENKRNVDGWKKRVDEYRVEINTQRARVGLHFDVFVTIFKTMCI